MDASLEHSIRLLHEDVLYYIFMYLDRKSLANFAQTCKTMRDFIYSRAALWRQSLPVLRLSDASEDTARSIKERNISTVSLNPRFYNKRALKYLETLEDVKTLVLWNTVLNRFSIRHSDYQYKSVECLLVHCVHIFKGRFEVEFVYSLPVFPNLKELHLYRYNCQDVDLSAFSCLPNLRHFEFCRVEPEDELSDGYAENMHFIPPGTLQKLERIAGVDIAILEELPMLKHYKIKGSYSLVEQNDGEKLSLESLESLGLPAISWEKFTCFLRCAPSLKALALASCSVSGLSGRVQSLATSCPMLSVIKLTNVRKLHEKVLKQILFELKHLQVMEVRLRSGNLMQLTNSTVSELLEGGTSIISLLGVLVDERLDFLNNLKFKSSAENSDVVLMRYSINSWQRLRKHSKQWNEAQGISYFYPKDSIRNIELSQHLACHTVL